MLFTNATGTGKTFTGLGIIKRFLRQGKGNVLIVTPTDKKNRDWASDAKRLDMEVTPLSGIGDNGGNGVAVTTYANFRQNESLPRRNWDLLVFDESHKISSAEGKVDTLAKKQLDLLGGAKDMPFRRAVEENKSEIRAELGKKDPQFLKYDLERNPESKNPVLTAKIVKDHFDDLSSGLQEKIRDRESEIARCKVLFLSATPFSYHTSLLYADGYLFDIPDKESRGYNQPSGMEDFFITNFGYRMRYNKLTKPDADVDVGVMEREFYEKLRESGAVSGRMLEIDKDYSREFFRVQSDLGEQIQAGMDIVMDYRQYPTISNLIHKFYDYNYITSLLECLKTKATVEAIKKDIAAGRKVVVFHNRNTGTPDHPFHLGKLYNYVAEEGQHQRLKQEIERFESAHPELVNLRLNDLQNPLMYFRRVFGGKALFFDGTIPAKRRAMNVEEFNDAKSGKNLIVVQIDAGKEGISLHDTKGDAQRVLYNLGLPTKPTDLIQSEGRIYRLGSKSNAIFRYPVTGLPMERHAFGSKINQRASTAENLGMGNAARNLRDALREGYMNAGESLPFDQQGVGGKALDRGFDTASDYDRAKTFYFGQLNRNSKNKSAEGVDYFATPEPIGYKMVQWAHLKPGDKVLEPSAGHGAIARFFPDTVDAKVIEPSTDLSSKLSVNTTANVIQGRFEDHNAVNKYDCVIMNPPFGVGGKTAIEHLGKAFDRHLNLFGRIIAIIPEGGMADRRFDAWMEQHEDANLTAEIGLPNVTFQRAGTSVKTKIVVIDKADRYISEYLPKPQGRIDIEADNIKDLFDKLEHIDMPRRGSFDSGRQYSLKRGKLGGTDENGEVRSGTEGDVNVLGDQEKSEISDDQEKSEISDDQEREIREAYDYAMNGEPVARLTGQEFQKDGTPLTEKVTRFYQEQYGGKAVHPELGEVKLDLEGVKDSLGHGIGSIKAAAYAAVPQMIEKGKIFDRQKNWKGRGYDTVVMAAPLEIGGVPYVGEVIVKQGADRQGFYLHEVEIKEKLADVFKTANGSTSPVSRLIITHLIEKIKSKTKNLEEKSPDDGITQKFGSGNTSLRQVAAGFRKIKFEPGTVNLDLGGGRFDEGTKYLAERGVKNLIFDPVNRDSEHNKAIFEAVKSGGVDTVTCNNVLNVIQEPEARSNVILQAAKALKPGGTAYFTVYEGDGTGDGRQSQKDAWQENRKTADYLDEIREHFSDVTLKNKIIAARGPITEGKLSAWSPDSTFKNPIWYSLKRHRQVNPIREPGAMQAEHAERIGDFYETRSNAEVNRQAERRLKAMGGFDGTIRMMLDGDFAAGSDVSQRVLQLVLNSDEFKALSAADREKISDLYIHLGMEVGRSLAARRLGVLDVNDIKSIQAHVNAFMAKLDKAKPKNDLRQQILDEYGVDIDNLPEDIVNDPGKLDEILRAMMANRASMSDKLYEFWINSILSGPSTHAANTLGNAANAAYELGVKRLAEAAVNVVLKRKDGATFGEFKEMYKAIDWRGAFDRASRAFKYEALTTAGKLERARIAIGGKTGRVIRLPGRFLRAADEFAKAIVQPMEATAWAYREGVAGKLKGNDLKDYIANQVMDPKSEANKWGHKRALDLTFQEDPGKAVEQLVSWREKGGFFGTLLKFELPFIKTPANILRQGVRKSPLGAVNLAWQTGKALAGKRKIDSQYISLVAEQLIAWGAVAMFAGMDDDDDMPFLTGTSPRYGSAEQKFKVNKVPPYSIRIGNNYYSYKRIEPLATGLAFIADGLDALKRAKRGEDGTRIMKRLMHGMKELVVEKSFLDSLGEINRIASDPERSVDKAATNFIASWMPNVVRQTVNMFDDNVRDNKSRARGEEWFKDQFRITTNRMGITKAAPKLDYFGREITKDSLADSGPLWQLMRIVPIQSVSPDDNMNRAELLMWRYNQDHPEEEYYPDVPAYYFTRNGKKLYMTGEDYQDFVRESGQLALKQINNAFRHGLLDDRRPTKKDIDLIKKIFSRARKEVRDKMYREHRYSE